MTDRAAQPSFWARLSKRLKRHWQKNWQQIRLQRSIRHLHGPKGRVAAPDEAVLIALVRDGSYYLDVFFDHYRALGIRHFVFVDNGSCDDTLARLQQEPGVAVLQSTLPWGRFENDFRATAARRYGQDRWCLIVDMDEIFDFEGRFEIGLAGFIRYLTAQGYTGVMAQMLEMFPKAALRDVAALPYRDVMAQFSNCDLSAVKSLPYDSDQTGLAYFLHQNSPAISAPPILFGGVRGKVFGENCCLSKHPLIFNGADVGPAVHPHASTGLHLAPMTALIKHYKFANDSFGRDQQSLASASIAHGEDRLRLAAIGQNSDLSLWSETAQTFPGISGLQQQGFLLADPEFTAHIAQSITQNPLAEAAKGGTT